LFRCKAHTQCTPRKRKKTKTQSLTSTAVPQRLCSGEHDVCSASSKRAQLCARCAKEMWSVGMVLCVEAWAGQEVIGQGARYSVWKSRGEAGRVV
jgi:hypothetical protein